MSKARDLASGAPAPAGVSTTELGYVDGVTSAIQTQLNQKPEYAAGKNSAINGGMDIWQRNTTVAGSTTAFTADRWQAYRSVAGSTFSRQSAGLTGFNYGMRIQRDSGNTSTTLIQTLQNYETVNTIPLAGQTVTLSWYAKAGANFSATSSQMFTQVYTGTGTDQNVLNGYTGSVGLLSAAVTITTSYVKYSQTFTIGSTATEMAIVFGFNPTGTASTNDWVEITGVQLEVGSAATAFSRTGGTYQAELAACQRYYYRLTPAAAYNVFGSGFSNAATNFLVTIPSPVNMRTAPTALEQSGTASQYSVFQGLTGLTCSAVPTLYHGNTNQQVVSFTVTAGLTVGQAGIGRTDNNTTAYLGWTAEL